MFKKILTLAAITIASQYSQAQNDTARTNNKYPAAIVIDVAYQTSLPFADMATDFKYALGVGTKINYLSSKNWLFALSGDYMFADQIRIDAVANLREANGYIIDQQGALADVKQGLRAFQIQASVGKIIPFNPTRNRRFGLETRLNAGYFQHWIRINFGGEDLLQLMGDYKKGYDRNTNGFCLQQYIGIRYMSNNRLQNFFAGFECTEAFTRNRRYWNYDQMRADNGPKLDILLGFRVGLSIPFNIYDYKNETLEDVKYH